MYEIINHFEIFTDGVFGAMMNVEIRNDGPVTIMLESPAKNK